MVESINSVSLAETLLSHIRRLSHNRELSSRYIECFILSDMVVISRVNDFIEKFFEVMDKCGLDFE